MAGDPAETSLPTEAPSGAPNLAQAVLAVPRADLIGVAALVALVAANFGPQLVWMWGRWMNSEYYGHGILIPPLVAYLIWRRRAALAELPRSSDRLGLVLVGVGLLIHLAAVQADVNFMSLFALLPIIWGLVLWLRGRHFALAVLFPIVYLGFMVPVDRLLIDAFSSPLQLLAAKMATGFSQLIGIPVVREGVNLSTPEYTFEVAIACSGLKSLTTLTALATLYAYLVEGRLWRKALLVMSSLPIALVANAARVTLIVIVARSLGPKAATGFLHGLSGMVVFTVGLLVLYGVGRVIQCHKLRDDI